MVAGHYRVLRRIGSGAMGVVWQARDERLGRLVAVKQLLLQPGASEGENEVARKRALREARIAAMLQHPNAVTIYDVVEIDDYPCLVMEYVPSRSLADVMDDRLSITPAEAAEIGSQIASALAAAHEKGIVHRDVKPGNLLLDESGTAKITDFGISRAAGDMTLTQTGVVAGTPAYFAPEVARGQDPAPAADVFSLASTLYAAVEGAPPFGNAENPFAMLHAVAGGEITQPRDTGPLTAPLLWMLRKEPAQRPTMAEAQRQLSLVAGGAASNAPLPEPVGRQHPGTSALPLHADPPPAPAPKRSGSRRSRYVAAALAFVALVVAGVLIAVFALPDGSSGGQQNRAAPPPSSQRNPSSGADTTTPGTVAPANDKPINWGNAGQLVINYYNGFDNPDKAWNMLTDHAKSFYGGKQEFVAYWSQYKQLSADHAIGVTPNPDGSVKVPVRLNFGYGEDAKHVQMAVRVTRVDGTLLIDSDTHR